MAGTITLLDSFARQAGGAEYQKLIGSLGGGYFVTADSSPQTLSLWHADDPTTLVDSLAYGADTIYTARNIDGQLWACHSSGATTAYLVSITQSSGALSATDIGSFAVLSSDQMLASRDDSQVVHKSQDVSNNRAVGVDTDTGAADWTVDWSRAVGATHRRNLPAFTPAVDRVFTYCSAHGVGELWDGPGGTLLDSIADPVSGMAFVQNVAVGPDLTFVIEPIGGTDPKQYKIGVLSTAADVCSWAWGPTTITTDWPGSGTQEAVSAAWGQYVTIAPKDYITTPYPAVSTYVVDSVTGGVSTSTTTSSDLGAGAGYTFVQGGLIWVEEGRYLVAPAHADTDTWTQWLWTPVRYLRQRQGPRGGAPRVSWPALTLRQRQTP